MSEGDRALDAWLALKLGWEGYTENRDIMWWCKDGKWLIHNPPHYTGRDWPQLAEALRAKDLSVLILYLQPKHSAKREDGATHWAQVSDPFSMWAIGHYADTPGLALGRAAEQALGGES